MRLTKTDPIFNLICKEKSSSSIIGLSRDPQPDMKLA
jgi:hypothetical protein